MSTPHEGEAEMERDTRAAAADYIGRAKAALAALPDRPEREVLSQAADFVLARNK